MHLREKQFINERLQTLIFNNRRTRQRNKKEIIFEWHYKPVHLENIKRTLNSRKKTHSSQIHMEHSSG